MKRLLRCLVVLLLAAAAFASWNLARPKVPAAAVSTAFSTPEAHLSGVVESNSVAGDDCCPSAVMQVANPAIAASPARIEKPASTKAIDEFRTWAERYAAAPVAVQARLEAEGARLASARAETFAGLIRHDPKAALDAVLPYALRKILPEEIARRIEHPVRGRGPLNVFAVTPLPGSTVEEPIFRTAVVKEKEYRVYTTGPRRAAQITTPDTRILGVGVELADGRRLMALREEPYEVLAKDEAADLKKSLAVQEAVCPISGDTTETRGDESAIDVGGEVIWLCSHGHIDDWLQTPDGRVIMYAGGSGTSPGTSPIVPATHTQGNKSFLAIRVRFANQAANFEPTTDASIQYELQQTVNKLSEWSYGKLESTFAFTPVLVLPQADTWYAANGGDGKLQSDASAAANAYVDAEGRRPYAYNTFDFPTVIYSTSAMGNYCGIASIGGNWNLVKCASARVLIHEWGHNFGLYHSNFWDASTDSPIGSGTHLEYESPFSSMSRGTFASFNTIERRTVGWLGSGDIATTVTGGTFRIYNADKTTLVAGRPYALRLRQNQSRHFHFEYRPVNRVDGNRNTFTDNGLLVSWTDQGSQLLDMRPMTTAYVSDAPLLIGETFSDAAQGMYVTPVAKGGISPDDWVDVVVNFEAGPGNATPVAALTASSVTPAAGASITLTAIASDPDGDVLAYAWEFGDRTYSTNNAAVQTRSWASPGQYNVRCTVSDRRGRSVARSLVVTVGSPGTFTIRGRIATSGGVPLPDALVRVDGDHLAYTDADGRYAITRLNPGSYTVTARREGWNDPVASFTNPVAVGPSAIDRNFTASPRPRQGGLTREQWDGIPGGLVSQLTSNTRFTSGTPDSRFVLSDFEAPESVGDNYGSRVRGFFRPPTTGAYIFYIASDDSSELWLSTSENPAAKVKIAQVNGFVTSGDYFAQPNQRSAPISLTFGQRYYIEALHKEGSGGDHLSVGATSPGPVQHRPIEAFHLDPISSVNPPAPANTVTIAATDATASEAASATGTFTLTRTGSTAAALTVYFDVGGTASYGSDFSPTGLSALFPAGESAASITLTPVNDTLQETSETVQVTLSPAPALYAVGASATAIVTIEDDEPAQVTITATDPSASEGGTDTGTFTITRSGATAGPIAVNITTGGSAVNGTDYATITSPVTIPAGQLSVNVTLTATSDALFEVEEAAVLTVASGVGYTIGSPAAATVRIAGAVGNGGGILREWWDGLSATGFVYDLTNAASFPSTPTGREIVTTSFTTAENRAENFGERWRGIFTAPVAGTYFFYIASDDYSELWLSTDATPERRQKVAYVNGSVPFQNWTFYPSQRTGAITLAAGQRYYIEAILKEGIGGDHMSVGVEYPNGALERPIPAHRLDPFTATTSLTAPWTSQDIGTTGSRGTAGLGSGILTAGPRHRYTFTGAAGTSIASGTSIPDTIAGANAVLRGAGAVFNAAGTAIDLPGGASTTQAYIDLPNGVATGTYNGGLRYTSVTYEAWVTVQTAQTWSRILDFGTGTAGEVSAPGGTFSSGGIYDDVFVSANIGVANDQRLARTGSSGVVGGDSRDTSGTTVPGAQVHIALVYDSADQNWRWYRNGVPMQVLPDTEGLSTMVDLNSWLGRSNFSNDANLDALLNEFRIYHYALTEAQLRGNFSKGPDAINTVDPGATGSYLVSGSGVLSTNAATDGFHLDSQTLTGNWEVRTRLVSLTDAGGSSVAGLMMREGTTATARHAFIGITPGGIGRFIHRIASNGNAALTSFTGLTLPQWLRIVRNGNTISGFVSADGMTWTQVGATATFANLASTLQVGFAVASGSTANRSALAQYDSLALSPQPGGGEGFLYERFEGIGGATITSLTSAPAFPHSPTVSEVRSGFFEVAPGPVDNFGERLRGYFTAPLTGSYTFYIAADDTAELWLSSNDTASARVRIATVPSNTGFREWTKHPGQRSSPFPLAAGQRYYMEVLHKDATGPDGVSVGVSLPNGTTEFPILASRLKAYVPPSPLSGSWTGLDVGAPSVAGSSLALPPAYSGPGEALRRGPRNRYTFAGGAGAPAADSTVIADSISGRHGTVRGAGAFFDVTGAGLGLPGGSSGTQAYVDLPNGVATGTVSGGARYASVSYELWFTQRTNRLWSRVLDIGTTSAASEITGPGGSFTGTNFITLSGNIVTAENQRLDRTGSAGTDQGTTRDSHGATQLNQLAHVVIVYDGASTMWRWYRNGQLMASILDTVGLAGLNDINVWLGRSNFSADQNLDAVLHEFRIYDYALTPGQVAGDFNSGPDVINTVDLPLPRAPRNRWSFDGTPGVAGDGTWIYDRIGGANAVVRGAGARFTEDGVSLLGGSSSTQAYIDLPNGVASGTYGGDTRVSSVTYELWATQSANGQWSKLMDFGVGTAGEVIGPGGTAASSNTLHLSANNALTQNPRLRRKSATRDAISDVSGGTVLGQRMHHVVAYDAPAAVWRWYRSGVLLATLPDVEGVATLNDVNNWLGRSQYHLDANWAGALHEFRIYDYALTSEQVLSNLNAGPEVLNLATPGLAGSVALRGSGDIATGSADDFQFASQVMDGDGEIIARVVSLQYANAATKAGVMIRESGAAGSRHVFMGVTPAGTGRYVARAVTNAAATSSSPAGIAPPHWVRLVRKGETVTGYTSADGVTWTEQGSTILSGLATDVLVGLASASATAGLADAAFDNVTVIRPTVTITATQNAVEYPRTDGTFTVSRTWDLSRSLVVGYSTGGDAIAGADYIALSGTVTIPAGQSSVEVVVSPINDAASEPPEVISATLVDASGYLLGTQRSATLGLNGTEMPAEGWQRSYFGPDWDDPSIAGDTADPDRDGQNNLLERGLNGNPNSAEMRPLVQPGMATGHLSLAFVRSTEATDLTLTVQGADSLAGPWTDLARSTGGGIFRVLAQGADVAESGTGSTRTVEVMDPFLISDPLHPRRFLRVEVRR